MAFDQKTRNLLHRTVTACRRVFDREFTAQLQELYGIQPDGTLTPCEALDHLGDEELEVARLLRSRINHLEGGEPPEALTRTRAKPENVARVIREQAFTVLNRLAALRLCEERGLVLECVRQGVNSEGFLLFMTTVANALGETHEAYRVYLQCLFDELAIDLGVLFDRFNPLALLFPRKDALEEVLRELNGSGKAAETEAIPAEQFAEIWKADEAIGWIYQYYNDEAERKQMRELSSAPRDSRELAVRNQFFTPRYVVEFLTDNTLGRLWYEMTLGETALRDRCHYLVRQPTEVFLKAAEAAPAIESDDEEQPRGHISQEELLRQPVYVPHRALKDPRQIRLLDPACGSMHFGLYAFDLLTIIYEEAWDIARRADEATIAENFAPFTQFAATFSDKSAFLTEVPRLIIEQNIHGIDIDPRAAQIAGLSLWLRAQRAWHDARIKPADRPRITRSNLVCAEPMPGEKRLLREFVEQQFDIAERPAFEFLLEKIFDRMALAGEAGSLLRIEEEIRSAISEARTLAETQPAPRQTRLFPGDERPEPNQLDLQGILDEHFWQRAEQRIYDALETYAEQAENGGGFQRRLFANDAAKGFAFIDICRKRYDVVVMNPPFGAFAAGTKQWALEQYPRTSNDIFAAFIERGIEIRAVGGTLGAITSRTGFFLSSFQRWREEILLEKACPTVFADLGHGVLDNAMVEVAAYCLGSTPSTSIFYRLLSFEDKASALARLTAQPSDLELGNIFAASPKGFRDVPRSPFAYWVSADLRKSFKKFPPLKRSTRFAARGPYTLDDFRFVRLAWEVPLQCVKNDRRHTISVTAWVRFFKGGSFARFYSDPHLALNWSDNGIELKALVSAYRDSKGWGPNWTAAINGHEYYFLPGLTWTHRTTSELSLRAMPAGCIFSAKGPALIVHNETERLGLLSLCNSNVFRSIFALSLGAADSAARSYDVGIMQRLPVPDLRGQVLSTCISLATRGWKLARSLSAGEETAHTFTIPACLQAGGATYAERSQVRRTELESISVQLGDIDREIDQVSSTAYGVAHDIQVSSDNGSSVQTDMSADLPEEDEETDEALSGRDHPADLVAGLFSWCLGCVLGRWDIRHGAGERPASDLPDLFAPLPVCPPGMLQGEDGLPILPETGRRLRAEGHYPLDVAWDGILVDDPEHALDVERNVRTVLKALWSDRGDDLEHEACELLGVPTLRDWLRRPAGFFADHLKRYSRSRRQAPIYWPLSTASGTYTLWLYYHRLTPDTLFRCLQQFVVPKLSDVERELVRVRTVLAANEGGSKERRNLEVLEGLRGELIEFRNELEFWAPKWKPNLNDGVLITAAPLWKLFRLPKWQKDLKACWSDLEKGEYDWAHLAYSLWPDRVREKCRTDRSIAIAHGLDDLCEVEVSVKKPKTGKKAKAQENMQEYFEG